MKALILLILPAVLLAQLPKPGGGGGGGGSSAGSSNPSCTFASSATTCSIDVSSLNVTTANYKSILAECFTGASTTQTPVTITSYAYTTGSGIVQTVAPTFGAAAAAGYCAANGNGGAGPTGPAGSTGATGSTGSTGAAGAGYGGTSTSALAAGSGLKTFTTQAGLAYLVGVPIRATSAGTPTIFMQGVVNSYSGTTLVIDVSEVGGVGTRADWNLSLIGIDGTAGTNGTNGAGYTATTTTSVTVSTGSKTVTTQAGLAYVVGSLVKIVSAATPANYVQGLATAYSGTSLTVNATETGGSGSFTDGNITIAGLTGATGPTGPSGTGGGYSAINTQTGTTYTFVNSDCSKLVTFNNSSSIAVTLPQAGAGGNFASLCTITAINLGAGTVTITPTSSTINLGATLALTTGQGAIVNSDGTNYQAMIGKATAGGGSINTQLDGSTIGTGITALNIQTTPDVAPTMSQSTGTTNASFSIVSTKWATRDQVQSGTDDYCSPASASSTVYACTHAHPLTVYTAGMVQIMRFDVGGSGGSITVNMDSLGAKKIFGPDGTTALTTTQSAAGVQGLMIYDGSLDSGNGGWKFQTGGTSTSGGSGVSYGVDTGTTNSIIVTVSPAITYTAGQQIIVKVKNTNNGSVSINVNGIGSTTVYNSLGVALSSGALSANADYLLVYNTTFGGFEYAGTGACIPNGAGMTCNAAGGNYITMTGTTSGFRSYTTEAVGANDNVTIVGYNSTPTSGNCAQWSTSGGAPVLAQASAPCGTGSPSATATFVMPWGGLDAGRATAAKAANTVLYIRYDIPYPGRILNSIVAQSFSSAAAAHPSWAVYDASCTKVASGSSVTTPTFQQIDQFTFTPITLVAGTYYFGVSSDAPDLTWLPSTGDGWGYGAQMANTGESASTYKVFTGSNPSTTASTTTTLPATCGTRTGITTAVVTIPFFSLQ